MDVRQMSSFESDSFDAVIDKGTLDWILCGDAASQNADLMLSEIHRILANNGVYVWITYGFPEHREWYFKNPMFEWEMSFQKIAKPNVSTASVIKSSEDK